MACIQYDGQCGPTIYADKMLYKHLHMMDTGIRRIIASVSDIADTEDKSCICYGCCM